MLLSDRIVMMTNGPAATIGEIMLGGLPLAMHHGSADGQRSVLFRASAHQHLHAVLLVQCCTHQFKALRRCVQLEASGREVGRQGRRAGVE